MKFYSIFRNCVSKMENQTGETDSMNEKESLIVDKDESGFEDVSVCSPEDNLSGSSFPMLASTPFSCTKQDDSGVVCAEKSPINFQVELTEGDISEIANENMEDDNKVVDEIERGNNHCIKVSVIKGSKDKLAADCAGGGGDNCDESIEESGSMSEKRDENLDDAEANSKCDNDVTVSDEKDNDDDFDEDKDFAEFVKRTSKSGSHVHALVDYGNTSSDQESEEEFSRGGKGKKIYRKRKQDSDDESDNGLDELQTESGDAENNSSDPVLLRHSQLPERGTHVVVSLSDLESESSDDEEENNKAKHESSDSESDDTPMDISEYGPPKHDWKAMFDLRNRELGYLPTKRSGLFTRHIQGSLQMVQRFQLQYKMTHHTGCVNALNFNKLGKIGL